VILVYPVLWAVAVLAMVRFPIWPVQIAGVAVIGCALHAMAILMHEGIHGNLFRRRVWDRWASFLLGAPALLSTTAYKVGHTLHHRYNRTDKDPDEFRNLSRNPKALSAAFYAWLVVGMPVYLIHVPLTAILRGDARQRAAVGLEYALLAALYAAVISAAWVGGFLDILALAWLIPMGIAAVFGNVRGWAEHALTRPGHPLTQTRTVTSNRLVSFLMCNLNYHLEHHLFPAMPWYQLPKLHRLLQEEYRAAGAFVYSSYVRFLFDAFQAGVHGLAPRTPQTRSA
jgi:fatty acid desaturase